jgi:hypothetical protein
MIYKLKLNQHIKKKIHLNGVTTVGARDTNMDPTIANASMFNQSSSQAQDEGHIFKGNDAYSRHGGMTQFA